MAQVGTELRQEGSHFLLFQVFKNSTKFEGLNVPPKTFVAALNPTNLQVKRCTHHERSQS